MPRSLTRVVTAKTVFFINESGTGRFGDDLYRQIKASKAWNRWDVVTDREKADLVLVLSPSDTVPMVITTASAVGIRDQDDRRWEHADALASVRHRR